MTASAVARTVHYVGHVCAACRSTFHPGDRVVRVDRKAGRPEWLCEDCAP